MKEKMLVRIERDDYNMVVKEAALEAAGGDDKDEEEEAAVVAAPPPPPAPSAILDPRPLAPPNVFFRMPTQSDRLL